ncbi:MAG: LuxR C-terminal-related transcriptional regulator [Umezawaea sp.]
MDTVADLGAEISRRVARSVPHDGYLLIGHDPVTGAGCFAAERDAYSGRARHELEVETAAPTPSPVLALGPGAAERHSRRVREAMAADGFGAALRIAFRWGELVLLRETGSCFSAAETALTHRLTTPLADLVRRFVTSGPLPPIRHRPPGVAVVSPHDTITTITAAAREALQGLTSSSDLFDPIRNITHLARRGPALTRVPTPDGWLALHGELVANGDVVVTVQTAAGALLLPAVAAWYGITPGERVVVEQAVAGLPGKQIAGRLHLSPHTVNDHLKSVYRKTGVHSREELLAGLG